MTQGNDTRVALVREDEDTQHRIREAIAKVLWVYHVERLDGEPSNPADDLIDSVWEELFPETDKPLRVSDISLASDVAAHYERGDSLDDYDLHKLPDAITRIEEELNRG